MLFIYMLAFHSFFDMSQFSGFLEHSDSVHVCSEAEITDFFPSFPAVGPADS